MSEKTYTQKLIRTEGRISALLTSSADKSDIKAQELSKIVLSDFSQNGFYITVTTQPHYVEGILELEIEVTNNGVPVILSNPIRIKNPPIMVHDGTWYKATIDGDVVELMNYKEDPEEALRQVIIQLAQTKWPQQ